MAGVVLKVDINSKLRDVTFDFKLFSIWTVLLYIVFSFAIYIVFF